MHSVAAIDVGSNATRLSAAWVNSTGALVDSFFHRFALRLGADVFGNGAVSEARQKALIQCFSDIARQLRERGVRTYRAVATSAMREARNGPQVARRIFERTGIQLEIISGVRESRLSRVALVRALGSVEPEALLLDLGGGSLEIERAHGRRGRSLPLGTVRLLEQFPSLNGPLSSDALEQLRQQVLVEVRRHVRTVRPAILAIGTGGNLDTLARLVGKTGARVPGIDLPALDAFAHAVGGMSNEERGQCYGVRPDRADLILPAVLIILALVDLFGLQSFVVPGTGLRETLLHDLLTPSDAGQGARRLLGQGHDVAAMADRCARLARELFDDLAAAHKLWPPALQPFITAVYAWYFGAFLQARDAVKHAGYIVRNLDNLDLDDRSRAVAVHALDALSDPSTPFVGHEQDHHAAAVLAGMLRVVIAMAPQGRRTSALGVDLLHDAVTITADLSAPLTPDVTRPLAEAIGRPIVVR